MGCSHLTHANDREPSVGHAVLRAQCPVHRESDHDPPFYVVSRHDDVLAMLKMPELWGNRHGPGVFFQDGGVLGSADEPDHTRHRSTLQPAFRPGALARLEPRVIDLCAEMWSASFSVDGEGDFVDLFAFPFPALMIAELLGVGTDDRDRFGEWSSRLVATLGTGDVAAYQQVTAEVWAFVDRLVDERTARHRQGEHVTGDVLGILAAAEMCGDLDRSEVRRLAHQLLVAGHETTASLIGLMLYRLIERPELRDRLRADPTLVDAAVEEFLRFDSPVQGLFRTCPVAADIGGVAIPARTKVQVLYASANRDPDRWPDADEIRFDRDPRQQRQHLAFGWGVHYCIGAPLARLQARHALRHMVEHFATVELAGEPELTAPFVLRGLASLPIRWTVR